MTMSAHMPNIVGDSCHAGGQATICLVRENTAASAMKYLGSVLFLSFSLAHREDSATSVWYNLYHYIRKEN